MMLDGLRKRAAFSLRNNDAETVDLAQSSVVDEGICREYHRWFSIVGLFKTFFLDKFLRNIAVAELHY